MSAADFKARQMAKRLATCRHFTGLMNRACAKGITYETVRNLSVELDRRFPCLSNECPTACAAKESVTREEIEAEDRALADSVKHIGAARAAIVATKKRAGSIDCPRCGAEGALGFTVSAYNGHVHAGCSTPGCLRWME